MYIYFRSENVPRQTFLSPGQRNVEKPWPRIFRLSVFHQSHPLLFFPVSPFFSPSSVLSTLCFSALFAAGGWKRWKLGRWVRGWGKCVCVSVEGASDDRWIFRKGSTELRVSSVFLSPLLPSLARERTRTLHSSLPFLCYSLVIEVLNKVFKIGWRFCKFSIISLLWLSKGVANTLESIVSRGINKNSVSDGPIKRQTTNTVPLIT